jgi:hypothetical protein
MSTNGHNTNCTPTPRTRSPQSSLGSELSGNGDGSALVVYIVTDIIYPTSNDFNLSKGVLRIDSCHSSKQNANARAKKIIYDGGEVNGGQYKVDLDKIIEQTERGLFTGIGIGGKGDGRENGCYARKCQVEGKTVDGESEYESESEAGMRENAEGRGWDGVVDGVGYVGRDGFVNGDRFVEGDVLMDGDSLMDGDCFVDGVRGRNRREDTEMG